MNIKRIIRFLTHLCFTIYDTDEGKYLFTRI